KPRVVARWRALWGRPAGDVTPAAPPPERPEPSVGANFAIRLMQIHVCIIYLMAGLSKLQGTSWWTATAIWGVIANYEFAPMHYQLYNKALRLLGRNSLVFNLFLTTPAYFPLSSKISYPSLLS